MMLLEAYTDCIIGGEIPPKPPVTGIGSWWGFAAGIEFHSARSECTNRGLWTVIDQVWTKQLADWIGDRKCLEVMAGGGWLAKALSEHGIDIIATDDFSWDGNHRNMARVFPVTAMDGVEAAKSFVETEVLVISWPPYEGEDICRICEAWGHKRPIVYIGEGNGGCNAPDEFWDFFRVDDTEQDFGMQSWWGLHDHIQIGVYEPHA